MTAPAAGTMTEEQLVKQAELANNMLIEHAFVPAFLDGMKAAGYPAFTDEDASHLLQLAMSLENVPDEEVFGKQASAAPVSRYGQAVTGLYAALGLTEKHAAERSKQQAWEKAADLARQMPQLYDAALLLNALNARAA